MIYPYVLRMMGDILEEDFYILPSSIHEVIVVPESKSPVKQDLEEMVREINETQVMENERLTNEVYHYDSKEHVFERADKFEERQKEKEAQLGKNEHMGKEQNMKQPKTKKHEMEL